MIAGDDLPDFIWLDRGSDVERLREAGALVPFDDYLDKYPNLKEWAGEDILNMLRSEDGKLYQFPNWYSSEPFGNAGYVVNKEIHDALGAPELKTFHLKQMSADKGSMSCTPHLQKGVHQQISAFALFLKATY